MERQKTEKHDLEQIYKENLSAVYKYLFCLTHDAYLAEELTQETFYQAAKAIQRFRGECKVSVWLCQIAKHLWYGELRKRKQELLSLDEALELHSDLNLEENYLQSLDKLTLFKKLHELDGSAKEVVYLRLTGELSFAEIGEIMGKTENWARVTFYRGKQKIVKGWNQNEP